jgi:hypothetical protein
MFVFVSPVVAQEKGCNFDGHSLLAVVWNKIKKSWNTSNSHKNGLSSMTCILVVEGGIFAP